MHSFDLVSYVSDLGSELQGIESFQKQVSGEMWNLNCTAFCLQSVCQVSAEIPAWIFISVTATEKYILLENW